MVLGHGEEEEGTVASVEPEEATLSVSLLNCAKHTKLVNLGVQLHDSLSVLSRVGARDLNSTGETA